MDKELEKAIMNALKIMGKDMPQARGLELHKQNGDMSNLIMNEILYKKDAEFAKKAINFYEQLGNLYRSFIVEFIGEEALTKLEE